MLPPGALFELKIHQYDSTREAYTELQDPLAGFQGADSRQGGEGPGALPLDPAGVLPSPRPPNNLPGCLQFSPDRRGLEETLK